MQLHHSMYTVPAQVFYCKLTQTEMWLTIFLSLSSHSVTGGRTSWISGSDSDSVSSVPSQASYGVAGIAASNGSTAI